MQQVKYEEVVDIAQYERMRPEFREKVMEAKNRRRVRVGGHFTFLFENHLTLLYQVQEMIRVERIVDEKAIAHEVDTYNELVPPTGGLGASLLLEYEDPSERAVGLRELLGIQDHVHLRLGDLPPVKGRFDTRQMGTERISSVQYVQFALSDEHRNAWRELGKAGAIRLAVDHPNYQAEATLPPDVVDALAEDMGV